MVNPFKPVPIIEIPTYEDPENLAAKKACEEFGVKCFNDKGPLLEAKKKVYSLGFYDGIL